MGLAVPGRGLRGFDDPRGRVARAAGGRLVDWASPGGVGGLLPVSDRIQSGGTLVHDAHVRHGIVRGALASRRGGRAGKVRSGLFRRYRGDLARALSVRLDDHRRDSLGGVLVAAAPDPSRSTASRAELRRAALRAAIDPTPLRPQCDPRADLGGSGDFSADVCRADGPDLRGRVAGCLGRVLGARGVYSAHLAGAMAATGVGCHGTSAARYFCLACGWAWPGSDWW